MTDTVIWSKELLSIFVHQLQNKQLQLITDLYEENLDFLMMAFSIWDATAIAELMMHFL